MTQALHMNETTHSNGIIRQSLGQAENGNSSSCKKLATGYSLSTKASTYNSGNKTRIDLTSPQAPVRASELPSNRPDLALSALWVSES